MPSTSLVLALSLAVAVLTAAAPGSLQGPVRWRLADSYNASNFFDKFDFYTGRSGDAGYARYQNRYDAERKGLIQTDARGVRIGPDSRSVLKAPCEPDGSPGRDSVRIESKASYNRGLLIARFQHLPRMMCGLWPAFWTHGNDWPNDGEIDILEAFNLNSWSQPGFRTSDARGDCVLRAEPRVRHTSRLMSEACTSEKGCYGADRRALIGHETGAIFALEWTKAFIKIYRWIPGQEPADINTDTPIPSSWGPPLVSLLATDCDLDAHFANQRIVLNLDFCGEAAGRPEVWRDTCAGLTREENCADFVARNPESFAEAYFRLSDIRYFDAEGVRPTLRSERFSVGGETEGGRRPVSTFERGALTSSSEAGRELSSTLTAGRKLSSTQAAPRKASSTPQAPRKPSSTPQGSKKPSTSPTPEYPLPMPAGMMKEPTTPAAHEKASTTTASEKASVTQADTKKASTRGGSQKSSAQAGSQKSSAQAESHKSSTQAGSKKASTPAGSKKPSSTPAGSKKPSSTPAGSKKPSGGADSKSKTSPAGSKRPSAQAGSKKPSSAPATQKKPSTPATTKKSSTPATPKKPSTPAQPKKPSTPAQSKKPSTPATPKKSSTPATPKKPISPAPQKPKSTPPPRKQTTAKAPTTHGHKPNSSPPKTPPGKKASTPAGSSGKSKAGDSASAPKTPAAKTPSSAPPSKQKPGDAKTAGAKSASPSKSPSLHSVPSPAKTASPSKAAPAKPSAPHPVSKDTAGDSSNGQAGKKPSSTPESGKAKTVGDHSGGDKKKVSVSPAPKPTPAKTSSDPHAASPKNSGTLKGSVVPGKKPSTDDGSGSGKMNAGVGSGPEQEKLSSATPGAKVTPAKTSSVSFTASPKSGGHSGGSLAPEEKPSASDKDSGSGKMKGGSESRSGQGRSSTTPAKATPAKTPATPAATGQKGSVSFKGPSDSGKKPSTSGQALGSGKTTAGSAKSESSKGKPSSVQSHAAAGKTSSNPAPKTTTRGSGPAPFYGKKSSGSASGSVANSGSDDVKAGTSVRSGPGASHPAAAKTPTPAPALGKTTGSPRMGSSGSPGPAKMTGDVKIGTAKSDPLGKPFTSLRSHQTPTKPSARETSPSSEETAGTSGQVESNGTELGNVEPDSLEGPTPTRQQATATSAWMQTSPSGQVRGAPGKTKTDGAKTDHAKIGAAEGSVPFRTRGSSANSSSQETSPLSQHTGHGGEADGGESQNEPSAEKLPVSITAHPAVTQVAADPSSVSRSAAPRTSAHPQKAGGVDHGSKTRKPSPSDQQKTDDAGSGPSPASRHAASQISVSIDDNGPVATPSSPGGIFGSYREQKADAASVSSGVKPSSTLITPQPGVLRTSASTFETVGRSGGKPVSTGQADGFGKLETDGVRPKSPVKEPSRPSTLASSPTNAGTKTDSSDRKPSSSESPDSQQKAGYGKSGSAPSVPQQLRMGSPVSTPHNTASSQSSPSSLSAVNSDKGSSSHTPLSEAELAKLPPSITGSDITKRSSTTPVAQPTAAWTGASNDGSGGPEIEPPAQHRSQPGAHQTPPTPVQQNAGGFIEDSSSALRSLSAESDLPESSRTKRSSSLEPTGADHKKTRDFSHNLSPSQTKTAGSELGSSGKEPLSTAAFETPKETSRGSDPTHSGGRYYSTPRPTYPAGSSGGVEAEHPGKRPSSEPHHSWERSVPSKSRSDSSMRYTSVHHYGDTVVTVKLTTSSAPDPFERESSTSGPSRARETNSGLRHDSFRSKKSTSSGSEATDNSLQGTSPGGKSSTPRLYLTPPKDGTTSAPKAETSAIKLSAIPRFSLTSSIGEMVSGVKPPPTSRLSSTADPNMPSASALTAEDLLSGPSETKLDQTPRLQPKFTLKETIISPDSSSQERRPSTPRLTNSPPVDPRTGASAEMTSATPRFSLSFRDPSDELAIRDCIEGLRRLFQDEDRWSIASPRNDHNLTPQAWGQTFDEEVSCALAVYALFRDAHEASSLAHHGFIKY
ncbi:hypothetical protein CDD80_2083 [Ophiocordyceps camponoti-rufipedis]|uniref:GH16 domain-containing protein n=1 Tax=Ophiocordyceps camponoti-rufipedis TaxID=2004952 RepID=A0A2C5Z1P8_9HYPO|nr:hypothetical protein CDD80_2083 [Ophiocordyceps camponoti-rufipedis]